MFLPKKTLPWLLLWTLSLTSCGTCTTVQVRFSPQGNCEQWVVETIGQAQQKILVQAYYFTSRPIADALIQAHEQDIIVRVLVDKSQKTHKKTQIHHMMAAGIPIAIDHMPGCAHNKVMIIDDDRILTGSYNWTTSAERRNAENLLLIRDKAINKRYKEEWLKRAAKARPVADP